MALSPARVLRAAAGTRDTEQRGGSSVGARRQSWTSGDSGRSPSSSPAASSWRTSTGRSSRRLRPRSAPTSASTPRRVGITVTAFLLTVAVLIPVLRWLSERFGVRRIFTLAIAVFTIASLLCALSTNLPMLVGMRVLQGVGGALMVPVGRTGGPPHHPDERDHQGHRDPRLAGPRRAHPRPVPRRTAHDLRVLALDLPDQRPAGDRRVRHRAPDHPPIAGRPLPPLDLARVRSGGASGSARSSTARVSSASPASTSSPARPSPARSAGRAAVAIRHLLRSDPPAARAEELPLRVVPRGELPAGPSTGSTINAVPFLLPLMFQDAFGWTPSRRARSSCGCSSATSRSSRRPPGCSGRSASAGSSSSANAVGIACMVGMAFLTPGVAPAARHPAPRTQRGSPLNRFHRLRDHHLRRDRRRSDCPRPTRSSRRSSRSPCGFGVAIGAMALALGFAWEPDSSPTGSPSFSSPGSPWCR